MQIQKRLTLGIGVLFAMILLLGIQSVGYIRDLSKASVNIITDNYNSLRYASDMMTSLDSIEYDSAAMLPLLETLALQQKNITEADEFQATGALQQRIAMLQDTVTPRTIQLVRSDLYRIMELNMAAIQARKPPVERCVRRGDVVAGDHRGALRADRIRFPDTLPTRRGQADYNAERGNSRNREFQLR